VLVVGAAVDEVEGDPRQLAACQLAQSSRLMADCRDPAGRVVTSTR
jgi:hypothetical protein